MVYTLKEWLDSLVVSGENLDDYFVEEIVSDTHIADALHVIRIGRKIRMCGIEWTVYLTKK